MNKSSIFNLTCPKLIMKYDCEFLLSLKKPWALALFLMLTVISYNPELLMCFTSSKIY